MQVAAIMAHFFSAQSSFDVGPLWFGTAHWNGLDQELQELKLRPSLSKFLNVREGLGSLCLSRLFSALGISPKEGSLTPIPLPTTHEANCEESGL